MLPMAYGPICQAEVTWTTPVSPLRIERIQTSQATRQTINLGHINSVRAFDEIGLYCKGDADFSNVPTVLTGNDKSGELKVSGPFLKVGRGYSYDGGLQVDFTLNKRMSQSLGSAWLHCAPVMRDSSSNKVFSVADPGVNARGKNITVEYSGAPYAVVDVPQKTITMPSCAVGEPSKKRLPVDLHYIGGYWDKTVPKQTLTWDVHDHGSNPARDMLSLRKDGNLIKGTVGFSQEAKRDKGEVEGLELYFDCKTVGKYTWNVELTTTLE